MAHISLTSAFLCVNCEEVGDNSRSCACCGGQGIVSLARLLNRGETADILELEDLWRKERA